jgi:hypothetical protein
MGVTIAGKKIVLELPKEEFEVLEPEVIEREVLNDLRKLKATKDFSTGKISERELVRILGPEKALSIIGAKKITEKSIKRAIDAYKAGL